MGPLIIYQAKLKISVVQDPLDLQDSNHNPDPLSFRIRYGEPYISKAQLLFFIFYFNFLEVGVCRLDLP